MRWILAIDTSGPGCGVALVQGDRPAGVERLAAPGTNRTLMPAIDRLCRQAGIGPRGLDGVAVALGPGSFTGLRIGLAAAKGLAVALDRPLAGVGTLDAVVLAARVPQLAQVPTPVPSGASGGAGRPAAPTPAPEGAALPEALGAPPGPPGAPGGAGVWLVIRPARRGEYYVAAYRDEPGPAAHHAPAGGSGRGAAAAAPQRLWGPELLPAAVLRAWLAGPPVLPPPLLPPGDAADGAGGPAQPGPARPAGDTWIVVVDPDHRAALGLEGAAADRQPGPVAPPGPVGPAGPVVVADPGAVPLAVARLAAPRLAAGGDDPALLAPLYLPAGSTFRPYPHPGGAGV